MYENVCVCAYIRMHVCMEHDALMYVCIHAFICMYVRTYACMYVWMDGCMYG